MTESQPFVDYYAILQVAPRADRRTIRTAYRDMAKLYHPDHPESADSDKFNAVIGAYTILRSAEKRAEYDLNYVAHGYRLDPPLEPENEDAVVAPTNDADAHAAILHFLYKRRREQATDPGVIGYYIQKMLKCSDSHFDFHVWYLKAKGFIEVTEQGTLAITIQGVDHVISMAQTIKAEKLLIAQAGNSEAAAHNRDT